MFPEKNPYFPIKNEPLGLAALERLAGIPDDRKTEASENAARYDETKIIKRPTNPTSRPSIQIYESSGIIIPIEIRIPNKIRPFPFSAFL